MKKPKIEYLEAVATNVPVSVDLKSKCLMLLRLKQEEIDPVAIIS